MVLVYVLFWILIIWGLRDCDIYWQEALILVAIWAACLAGFTLLPAATIVFILGAVLLDVYLLMKVLGQDVAAS